MENQYALYLATIVGALALMLMMPRQGFTFRKLGGLLGASALGGAWLYLSRSLPADLGIAQPAMIYYYIFSGLAIGAAVMVITSTRPVRSALWFVMVVLATSGLFLLLSAEFMAFAMVIIYGGAILVTYVFVIMLASQVSDEDDGEGAQPEYDRVAREPYLAVAVGFLLMAALLNVAFQPQKANPLAAGPSDEQILRTVLSNRPANVLAGRLIAKHGDIASLVDSDENPEPTEASKKAVKATLARPEIEYASTSAAHVDNAERIGLDLFKSHPLGLELAGVILLASLVGAVVIARKRVE